MWYFQNVFFFVQELSYNSRFFKDCNGIHVLPHQQQWLCAQNLYIVSTKNGTDNWSWLNFDQVLFDDVKKSEGERFMDLWLQTMYCCWIKVHHNPSLLGFRLRVTFSSIFEKFRILPVISNYFASILFENFIHMIQELTNLYSVLCPMSVFSFSSSKFDFLTEL